MNLLAWSILVIVVGVVLLIAEVGLPTHGILGVVGVIGILAGIGLLTVVDPWVGVSVLAGCLLATPFFGAWMVRVWPRTPVGRRLVLAPSESRLEPLGVQIGQAGVAVTEMRPIGTCEFAGNRMEALSEHGIIAAGRKVKVVDLNNRRPVVRPV